MFDFSVLFHDFRPHFTDYWTIVSALLPTFALDNKQ